MNIAITYYKDIPIKLEEYEKLIGKTVINNFEADENIEKITFVRFNKNEYSKWLNKRKDTQDLRAQWNTTKINPAIQMQKNNKKEKICIVCENSFIGTGKSKFCSNRCKQKNKNDKK